MADTGIQSIGISFAVPVTITRDMERVLVEWIETLARAHQPEGCVHWLAEMGYRPRLSQSDARFLGRPVDADAPESGEPTFDHSALSYVTECRERYDDERTAAVSRSTEERE